MADLKPGAYLFGSRDVQPMSAHWRWVPADPRAPEETTLWAPNGPLAILEKAGLGTQLVQAELDNLERVGGLEQLRDTAPWSGWCQYSAAAALRFAYPQRAVLAPNGTLITPETMWAALILVMRIIDATAEAEGRKHGADMIGARAEGGFLDVVDEASSAVPEAEALFAKLQAWVEAGGAVGAVDNSLEAFNQQPFTGFTVEVSALTTRWPLEPRAESQAYRFDIHYANDVTRSIIYRPAIDGTLECSWSEAAPFFWRSDDALRAPWPENGSWGDFDVQELKRLYEESLQPPAG